MHKHSLLISSMLLLCPPMASHACTVNLLFAGDAMAHRGLQRMWGTLPEGYASFMTKLTSAIKGADLAFVNIETPIGVQRSNTGARSLNPPDINWSENGPYSGYPAFNAPRSMAEGLYASGFRVAQMANNHAMDRASRGTDTTLNILHEIGFNTHGARGSEQAPYPSTTVEVNICPERSLRIGIVSCTFSTNGIVDKENRIPLCYGSQQKELLNEIQRFSLDPQIGLIIFTPHWGEEYMRHENAAQKDLAKKAIRAGADMIIGTHPHVLEPLTTIVGDDNKSHLVAYSLGNFVSYQFGVEKSTSILLNLTFEPSGTNKWNLVKTAAIPIGADDRRTVDTHPRSMIPLCENNKRMQTEIASIKQSIPSEVLDYSLCK